ncbi:MAG TPA: MFS transporter [Roseiflexaceae bacterium]|nr:MFS transporter [Roseiflexaceae bacterium]
MQSTYHPSTAPRRTLILACGVFLAAGICLASLGPLLPSLAARIERDIATLGWLFTALSGGVMLAQFGVGSASDRFGQRPVLALGMLLMGGGAFGVTLSQSFARLLAAAIVTGIGFGAVMTAGNLLIARLFPTRSAAALNGMNLFFGVGSMVGPMVVGQAGSRLDMPHAALWLGGILLLVLAPAVLLLAAAALPMQTRIIRAERSSSRPATLWLSGLLLLIYTGTEVGFAAWLAVYMSSSAHLTPVTAALVVSGFWLALTFGRAIGAGLGMRLAPQSLLAISLLGIFAATAILIMSVGSLDGSVAGVLLFGLSCGPVFPTLLALVTAETRGSGTAASLVLALGNCGGLIIPALLGWLLSRYGPSSTTALLLGAALAMLLLFAATIWMRVQATQTPEGHGTPAQC